MEELFRPKCASSPFTAGSQPSDKSIKASLIGAPVGLGGGAVTCGIALVADADGGNSARKPANTGMATEAGNGAEIGASDGIELRRSRLEN